MKSKKGLFITIEGASGVGKSTLIQNLKSLVASSILFTKEPSVQFDLSIENTLQGKDLLKALVKDRAWHVQNEILPAINDGEMIISDRYILSSLVFQRMDGLSLDYIWSHNKMFPVPDLTIILTIDESLRTERLESREYLSRLKQSDIRSNEARYTCEGGIFLQEKGWNITFIDTSNNTQAETAEIVCSRIDLLISENIKKYY